MAPLRACVCLNLQNAVLEARAYTLLSALSRFVFTYSCGYLHGCYGSFIDCADSGIMLTIPAAVCGWWIKAQIALTRQSTHTRTPQTHTHTHILFLMSVLNRRLKIQVLPCWRGLSTLEKKIKKSRLHLFAKAICSSFSTDSIAFVCFLLS